MTKTEFLIAYILARANAHTGGLEGVAAIEEAIKAWNRIQLERFS